MKRNVLAPKWYWELSEQERARGRCGPGRRFGHRIVPDKILGCCIRPACQVHDQMYKVGQSEAYKKMADSIFLINMNLLIDNYSANALTAWVRKNLPIFGSKAYYMAVRDFGNGAFWDEKKRD